MFESLEYLSDSSLFLSLHEVVHSFVCLYFFLQVMQRAQLHPYPFLSDGASSLLLFYVSDITQSREAHQWLSSCSSPTIILSADSTQCRELSTAAGRPSWEVSMISRGKRSVSNESNGHNINRKRALPQITPITNALVKITYKKYSAVSSKKPTPYIFMTQNA